MSVKLASVLCKHVNCRCHQGRVMIPSERPDLPNLTINICYSPQFTGSGFAGPLYTKIVKKDIALKTYILLFPSASSCAVPLELVRDMINCAFICAFKHF